MIEKFYFKINYLETHIQIQRDFLVFILKSVLLSQSVAALAFVGLNL